MSTWTEQQFDALFLVMAKGSLIVLVLTYAAIVILCYLLSRTGVPLVSIPPPFGGSFLAFLTVGVVYGTMLAIVLLKVPDPRFLQFALDVSWLPGKAIGAATGLLAALILFIVVIWYPAAILKKWALGKSLWGLDPLEGLGRRVVPLLFVLVISSSVVSWVTHLF